jgi:phosphonate transport system permease protein
MRDAAVTVLRVVRAVPPAPPRAAWTVRWLLVALLALVGASFATLDLQWRALFAADAAAKFAEFLSGFAPPDLSPALLSRVLAASFQTLAMSLVGTALAAVAGLALALPASVHAVGPSRPIRAASRLVLNMLRSIPELVWAALLVIAAGLGPLPGTLALAAHTTGVLGRLFADALENLPREPAQALRDNGASRTAAFLYAKLPQALPQFASYTLYRWENNIRAAAVLGVVGAGGLGQLLYFHLSLFHFQQVATVLGAMLMLVALVDALSYWARQRLTRA